MQTRLWRPATIPARENTRIRNAAGRVVVAEILRFPDSPRSSRAKQIPRATFFHVAGPSGRLVTCAVFEVETGLELRLSYGDTLMRRHVFCGADRDGQCVEAAALWRAVLLEKGFVEQE